MSSNGTRARRDFAVQSLEPRQLLSVNASALQSDGFEPIQWQGKTVYAKPGQWIARLDGIKGSARKQLQRVNAALGDAADAGLKAVRHLGKDGLVVLESGSRERFKHVKAALAQADGLDVGSIEPDFALWSTAIPNDTYYSGHQWGLNNTAQTGGTFDADIDAPEAWDKASGDGSVVVGVIDSGIDYNHPDLAANIWRNPGETAGNGIDDDANGYVDDIHGWDFFNNDNSPMDDNGHGTHVAGTIAATGNNAMGVTGVAWNAKVMALKFLGADGTGSLSAALAAINYATKMRTTYGVNVRVTNNSWGGGGYSSTLHDAISKSAGAGILFVAAAGNGGTDGIGDNNDVMAEYPADYNVDNVLSVAASDHHDRLGSFSNYGAASVDLAAPGVDIASTVPGAGYAYMSGTSMATPHVSGVAALAWSLNPDATYQTVKNAILTGVDKVTALSGKVATGGRLNAFKTLANMPAQLATPAAPSGLAAAAVSSEQIRLSWTDNSTTEEGFRVYMSSDGGATFAAIGTVAAEATAVDVSGLLPGTTYHYRVRAYNAAGESSDSNTAAASTNPVVTVPVAPANLTAAVMSSAQVKLSWSDRSANENGFYVERRLSGSSSWSAVANLAADATSWQDSGLGASTTYVYRVRAYNSAGSAVSSEVSATTSANAAPALGYTRDIGNVAAAGSAGYDSSTGTYAVRGSGSDIWSTSDEFRFAYATLTGDGQIVAKVSSIQAGNTWAKVGVMFRETLAANSRNVFLGVTPSNGLTMQRRATTGGTSTSVKVSGIAAPHWVKLVRTGGTLTGYRSADGVSWTRVASVSVSMAGTVYVGLAVTSHADGAVASANFNHVSVGPVSAAVATRPFSTTLVRAPIAEDAENPLLVVLR